jgi:phosphoribosylformimino-5-aminoimidazole carboxamide ribotide isomerase
MTSFDLLPAIDLRGGRVVRLRQGDFGRETANGDDPVAAAVAFVDAGAHWLHVVDLDGAREGRPVQGEVVGRIVAAVGERASVEVAGGLRSAGAVATVLGAGAARAVVGTAALADPAFATDLIERHGANRIAVALDIRAGVAVGHGWADGAAGIPAGDALDRLAGAGVRWFEVTAVDRDGMLGGPDLELVRALGKRALVERRPEVRIIASGGIRSVQDLRVARSAGCAGAIVGRALYEGGVDLAAALAELGAEG